MSGSLKIPLLFHGRILPRCYKPPQMSSLPCIDLVHTVNKAHKAKNTEHSMTGVHQIHVGQRIELNKLVNS